MITAICIFERKAFLFGPSVAILARRETGRINFETIPIIVEIPYSALKIKRSFTQSLKTY